MFIPIINIQKQDRTGIRRYYNKRGYGMFYVEELLFQLIIKYKKFENFSKIIESLRYKKFNKLRDIKL